VARHWASPESAGSFGGTCDVTETDASMAATGPNATTCLVLVQATACWTALAESFSGADVVVDAAWATAAR
jgi:hypothetical protein